VAQQHQSTLATRLEVAKLLKEGHGPTAAFEDVAEAVDDPFLTKEAVSTQATRIRRREVVPDHWPKDTIQCLLILKDVLANEVASESPVPGYIQVSLIANFNGTFQDFGWEEFKKKIEIRSIAFLTFRIPVVRISSSRTSS